MKRFINNLSIFLGLLLLFFTILFLYFNTFSKGVTGQYRLGPQVSKIVVGDSHLAVSIDDRLLTGTKNVCVNREGFVYSFYKMKSLMEIHPHVNTVFIGAGYHNFSDYYDDNTYDPAMMCKYFFILPAKIRITLLKRAENPPLILLKSILNRLSEMAIPPTSKQWLGSYKNSGANFTVNEQSVKARILRYFYRNDSPRNFSTINIQYFKAIISFCREKNISLYVLNTPVHPAYKKKIPAKFVKKYYSLIRENHATLIEFEGLTLGENDFLPDGDHLSASGTIATSQYLRKLIERKCTTSPGTGLLPPSKAD